MKNIKILDCTIRDGGYLNNWNFDKNDVRKIYQYSSKAGIDIFEIGFLNKTAKTKEMGDWYFSKEKNIEYVTKNINGAKIGAMIDYKKSKELILPKKKDTRIDVIRLASHKNNLLEAMTVLEEIHKKGYETSLQMMGYSTFSKYERKNVLNMLEYTNIDYFYIADSYGSLFPKQIAELFSPLIEIPDIKIGFHAHNNLQLALANTLKAIECGADIIDGTIYGMGRGAGNLPLESLVAILQKKKKEKYNVIPLLDLIEKYFNAFKRNSAWGYQYQYMLSGLFNVHPYYAKEILENRKNNIDEMYEILDGIGRLKPIGFEKKVLKKVFRKNKGNNKEKNEKRIVALMPMKEHSERVPNKNIRIFNNKPLYSWMLKTLLSSNLIDEVLVNTDSAYIKKEIEKKYPTVKVIERPKQLCGDFVSMNDIIKHDISIEDADIYVQTHSTNPLLEKRTIDKAILTFLKNQKKYDSLFGVTPLKKMFWDFEGNPINHKVDSLIRTQDLKPVYEENSNIYIFTKETIYETSSRVGKKPYMFEIPKDQAYDIDELIDFKIAEKIHEMRK